jgi:AcrR family transcriptional regulator
MPKINSERADQQRQRIIDAAASLFADKGFARTSMADIVVESGLSMGTVYHYFGSKESLIVAVVTGRDGRVDGQFPAETWREMLRRLSSYLRPDSNGARHPKLVAQIWGEAAVSDPVAELVRTSHARLQGSLAEKMSPSTSDMAIDAHSASELALAALVGMSSLIAAGFPVDEERFASALTGLLAGPDEPRSSPAERT